MLLQRAGGQDFPESGVAVHGSGGGWIRGFRLRFRLWLRRRCGRFQARSGRGCIGPAEEPDADGKVAAFIAQKPAEPRSAEDVVDGGGIAPIGERC